MAAKAKVEAGHFKVDNVETKPMRRNPPPPFTTSTMQQEAARKLGFAASHTMRIAQQLYEDGAITYMRTDGVQMDAGAISEARKAITERYSGAYIPEKPRHYTTKAKNAQEAHEAIRPTDFNADRKGSGDHAKLYDLIFKRALASQMETAQLERTTVNLADGTGQQVLRATGQVIRFPDFWRFTKKALTTARMMIRVCCRSWPRAIVRRANRSMRPSISPSHRRAFLKPVWSSGWKNWALAVPPLMPRSCRF
jgi:DNA topoisomerase-1